MLYGLLSNSAVSFDTTKDIPDLTGKVIAITGGNAGLGKETILRLAPYNPSHIYILSRNPSSTATAITSITSQLTNPPPITHIPCDLSDLSSVQQCAQTLQTLTPRLDILFLNAGIMLVPPGLTKQGYEIQFGTNHVAHFLLAELLMPLLLSTTKLEDADVRVIVLSSIGMGFTFGYGITYSSLQQTGTSFLPASLYRYGQSKLANALFALRFEEKYRGEGVTCVAIHPGIITTGLWSSMFGGGMEKWGGFGEWVVKALKLIPVVGFRDVEEGARNQIWAAVGEKGDGGKGKNGDGKVNGGEFYTPVGVRGQGSSKSVDINEARKLWDWSEKELAAYLK